MKIKAAVLSVGLMIALLLLLHYFTLSRNGLPVDWMLYLGLPITAAGVLFALRLVNLGAGWETTSDGPARQPRPSRPPQRSVPERLKELETLHGQGTLSETEYIARRIRIIASM